jgi:hypothetical protein
MHDAHAFETFAYGVANELTQGCARFVAAQPVEVNFFLNGDLALTQLPQASGGHVRPPETKFCTGFYILSFGVLNQRFTQCISLVTTTKHCFARLVGASGLMTAGGIYRLDIAHSVSE